MQTQDMRHDTSMLILDPLTNPGMAPPCRKAQTLIGKRAGERIKGIQSGAPTETHRNHGCQAHLIALQLESRH